MAPKRKAPSSPETSTPPQKKPSLTTHEKKADPLRTLPFDCASLILQSLDIRSLILASQVDTGWRSFINLWISTSGLRQHFPSSWTPGLRDDPVKAVKLLKGHACPTITLPTGRPTGARKIIATERFFSIAGDYAAWVFEDGIYFQDLRYRDDEGFYPVQRLPFSLEDRVICLFLNAEGYLLVRVQPLGFRDHLFNLKTGEIQWTYPTDEEKGHALFEHPKDKPIAMGSSQIYYATTTHISALDLKTGKQLYSTPQTFRKETFLSPQPLLSRNSTATLNLDGRELLILLILDGPLSGPYHAEHGDYTLHSTGVLIIDGVSGRVMQRIEGELGFISYLAVEPEGRGFSVVSCVQNGPGDNMPRLHVRKYGRAQSPGRRGEAGGEVEFEEQSFESLNLDVDLDLEFPGNMDLVGDRDLGYPLRDGECEYEYTAAIDPYRRVFARIHRDLIPRLGEWAPGLAPRPGPALIVSIDPHGLTADIRNFQTPQPDPFHAKESNELTLYSGSPSGPGPGTGDRDTRRPFAPWTRSVGDYAWMHFGDGDRLVLEVARRIVRPSWAQAIWPIRKEREFYIFDFGLRSGGLRGDRNLEGDDLGF